LDGAIDVVVPNDVAANDRRSAKKPTWLSTPQVLDHVGLLVNGLPGAAGPPFI